MAHLTLRHKNISSHLEEWTIKNGKIDVVAITPQNYPTSSQHTMDKSEALRQYALMTSSVEGWEVEEDSKEWHTFIEAK